MYYNPALETKYVSEPSITPLKFERSAYFDYVNSNKKLKKQLEEAAELSRKSKNPISVMALTAVLNGLAFVTSGFVTCASQKEIAKRSNVSVRTVKAAVSFLRKVGVIRTYHRYKTVGKDKMRTTSRTVLIGFISFLDWASKRILAYGNTINKIRCRIDRMTGEIFDHKPWGEPLPAVICNNIAAQTVSGSKQKAVN